MFEKIYRKYVIIEEIIFYLVVVLSGVILSKLEYDLWDCMSIFWKIIIPFIWIFISLKAFSRFYKISRYINHFFDINTLDLIKEIYVSQKERSELKDLDSMLGVVPTSEIITFIRQLQETIGSEQGKRLLNHILRSNGYSNYIKEDDDYTRNP